MELESLSEASASASDEPYDDPFQGAISQPVLVEECMLMRYVHKTRSNKGTQADPETAHIEEASLTRETLVLVDEEMEMVSNGKLTCSYLQQRTGFYDMTPRTAPL